ncbi:MAG: hypothetical protein D6819_08745 [Gammaproteobacteria bacterium]|nr:MAG: hypothetical protein D6819_08745 [Gammaproteobacteria bacterium]
MKKLALKVTLLTLPVFLAACASTKDLEKVKATADQALRAAEQASQAAGEAKNMAAQASSKADRAMEAAQEAQACCEETNEKIDRMFKRSMYK